MPIPRKVLIRVIGAPLLVAALCGIIYWGHQLEHQGRPNTPLKILMLTVALLCGLEFYGMCAVKGIVTSRWAGLAALAILFLPTALLGLGGKAESFLRFVPWTGLTLCVLFKLVFCYGRFTPEGAALTFLGFAYIALLDFVPRPGIAHAPVPYHLLFLLAAGKGSDMAAFVAGKTFGKHKMAPEVSPNKTWEGGIAGGVVGTVAGFLILTLTPLKRAYAAVPGAALLFLALGVTIAAQVGDLVKSAFKRWAGVKDSGRLLPEFGGMIDMVDSFIVAAPVAFLLNQFLSAVFS